MVGFVPFFCEMCGVGIDCSVMKEFGAQIGPFKTVINTDFPAVSGEIASINCNVARGLHR